MEEHLLEHLADSTDSLKEFIGEDKPLFAVILGSGLNPYASTLEDIRCLPYGEVPHMNVSTAIGHKGQFVLGRIPGTDRTILCMQGRLHGYEGNTSQEVAFPVWLMSACGIDTLVVTNAVGAINPSFKVGGFCLMTDHINFTGRNPLAGLEPDKLAMRFVPMLDAYDPDFRTTMLSIAQKNNITVDEGVYLGLLGPSFETPAEIRMFAGWGADTVAMSVVEEVIAARHCKMRVMGLSLISNMACGVKGGDPGSDDIMQVADKAVGDFGILIDEFAKTL